jgi:hypothetical protein
MFYFGTHVLHTLRINVKRDQRKTPDQPDFLWVTSKIYIFACMNSGYELLLPDGLLDYFEVVRVDKTPERIIIHLDERYLSIDERSGKRLEFKGFYPSISIHDFPLRGKALILQVRRRRWLNLDTGDPCMREWEVVT